MNKPARSDVPPGTRVEAIGAEAVDRVRKAMRIDATAPVALATAGREPADARLGAGLRR